MAPQRWDGEKPGGGGSCVDYCVFFVCVQFLLFFVASSDCTEITILPAQIANRLRILINLCCRGKSQRNVIAADGRVEGEADSRRRSRADSINLSITVFSLLDLYSS